MYCYLLRFLSILLLALGCTPTFATIVRFETNLGSFDVRLFNLATPQYVQNLISYINVNAYDNTFIHRSVPGFIVQGGGYYFDPNANLISPISSMLGVPNEPGISNIRGTFAMAKLGGNPDSATNEWFPNISHNTQNLDNQNGGFTVFGSILGNGLDVIDAIASLPRLDLFPDEPLDAFNTVPIFNVPGGLDANLVKVNAVEILTNPAGDFDLDGVAGSADLSIWEADYDRIKIIGGDFNDDKEISRADLNILMAGYNQFNPFASIPAQRTFAAYSDGDTNGDSVVDGFDFLRWQQGAGKTTDVAADADGDAKVTGLDFLRWQQSVGTAALSGINSVPEASSLTLFLLALPVMLRARCRPARAA